jgi:hypothetical protein
VSALLAGTRRVRLLGAAESYQVAALATWLFREVGLAALADRSSDLANYPGSFEPGDLVIALSQSGEDEHAQQLLARARDFGLPTIALTGAATTPWTVEVDVELTGAPSPLIPAAWFVIAGAFLAALAARLEPGSPLALAAAALPHMLKTWSRAPLAAARQDDPTTGGDRRVLIAASGPFLPAARALVIAEHARSDRLLWSIHHDEAPQTVLNLLHAGDLLIELNRADAGELALVATQCGAAHWQVQANGAAQETSAAAALTVALPVQRFLADSR